MPVDSDVEVDDIEPARPSRPVHLRWKYVALVAVGGAVGTAARVALTTAIPSIGAFPLAMFAINITGAFVLGLALEFLRRLGPDEGHRRRLRLLIGTGFLGGYTSYSTLAVGTVTAASHQHAAVAVSYAALSVIGGAAAAFGGIALGVGAHTRLGKSSTR